MVDIEKNDYDCSMKRYANFNAENTSFSCVLFENAVSDDNVRLYCANRVLSKPIYCAVEVILDICNRTVVRSLMVLINNSVLDL